VIFIVDWIEPRWQAITFAVVVLTLQQGFFEAHYYCETIVGFLEGVLEVPKEEKQQYKEGRVVLGMRCVGAE